MKLNLENLKKQPVFKSDESVVAAAETKPQHGGAREGCGRKATEENEALRELRKKIREHGSEIISVKIKQKNKKGQEIDVEMKMPRMLALLNQLFATGMKGNVKAISLYLDRTLGRQPLPIKNDDEETEENVFRLVTSVVQVSGEKK